MGTVPFCHVIKLSIIDYLGMCKRGLSPFASFASFHNTEGTVPIVCSLYCVILKYEILF